MSSSALLLAGCVWHVGNPPVDGGWRVDRVEAPVAEPDVDDDVRAAVEAAVAARGAGGETPLTLVVQRADWAPAQRGDGELVYVATLELIVTAGERKRTCVATRTLPDPGDGALAQATRAALFRELAAEAAAEGVAWLVDGGGGAPPAAARLPDPG